MTIKFAVLSVFITAVTIHGRLQGRVDVADSSVSNRGPYQVRSNKIGTVPVTRPAQLRRYQVEKGDDGKKLGNYFICMMGQNMKFVRNTKAGWVMSDGEKCDEGSRYQLQNVGGGAFGIKNVRYQQWWSCRSGGGLWGVGQLDSWGHFRLYVDGKGGHLTIRSSDWPDYFVYLWTDGYLYCSNYPSYYEGRNTFVVWKKTNKEREATDGHSTLLNVDNRQGTSEVKKDYDSIRIC